MRKALLTLLITLLLFTRLINIDWGLPYPFHPDERNMADAITRLDCNVDEGWQKCFDPEFYAYGQAPLYIAWADVQTWHALTGRLGDPITFNEAVIALRLQSVTYSILTVWVLLKIMQKVFASLKFKHRLVKKKDLPLIGLIVFTFQAYAIQYAHFGTTESLLMLLYTLVILLSMKVYEKFTLRRALALAAVLGVSLGVKVSAIAFAGLPGLVVLHALWKDTKISVWKRVNKSARYALLIGGIIVFVAVVLSPQNVINWKGFLGSMNYEIGVGDGSIKVFYTRQFENTIPWLYQFVKIFPYSHGWVQVVLFMVGFVLLPWRNPYVNILRLGFVMYFVPSASLYTKWSRFMAPVMPVVTLIAFSYALFGVHRRAFASIRHASLVAAIIILTYAGVAYVPVYTTRDVRFKASEWMHSELPEGSRVLIETGNVINLPVSDPDKDFQTQPLRVIPFDMYNVDVSSEAQERLWRLVEESEYIVIASRRVFANYTCQWPDRGLLSGVGAQMNPLMSGRLPGWCEDLQEDFPVVNEFFRRIFDERQYELIATFDSYPHIAVPGFEKRGLLWELPDEAAEEAWTVFDHPVVRVYKRL